MGEVTVCGPSVGILLNKKNITVLIPVWKRYDTIVRVAQQWIDNGVRVLVWDNGGGIYDYDECVNWFMCNPNVDVIMSNRNYGGQSKFMMGNSVTTDYILVADDDIITVNGVVESLVNNYVQLSKNNMYDIVVGCWGRKFSGPSYSNAKTIRGWNIDEPVPVDFLGRMYFGRKEFFSLPMKGVDDTRLDDLAWSRELISRYCVKMFCVPTPEWKNAENANDETSISQMPDFWKTRDDYVKEFFKNEKWT